jgi:hypothetical protein
MLVGHGDDCGMNVTKTVTIKKYTLAPEYKQLLENLLQGKPLNANEAFLKPLEGKDLTKKDPAALENQAKILEKLFDAGIVTEKGETFQIAVKP